MQILLQIFFFTPSLLTSSQKSLHLYI